MKDLIEVPNYNPRELVIVENAKLRSTNEDQLMSKISALLVSKSKKYVRGEVAIEHRDFYVDCHDVSKSLYFFLKWCSLYELKFHRF